MTSRKQQLAGACGNAFGSRLTFPAATAAQRPTGYASTCANDCRRYDLALLLRSTQASLWFANPVVRNYIPRVAAVPFCPIFASQAGPPSVATAHSPRYSVGRPPSLAQRSPSLTSASNSVALYSRCGKLKKGRKAQDFAKTQLAAACQPIRSRRRGVSRGQML